MTWHRALPCTQILYEANHLMPSGATSNNKARRAVWLKTLHHWHWISSSVCLLGMLIFSITGITLNHSAQIEAKPVVTSAKAKMPRPLQAEMRQFATGRRPARAAAATAPELWRDAGSSASLDLPKLTMRRVLMPPQISSFATPADVDSALSSILGRHELNVLAACGRYRRDVY
jgi:hypothetical protein